MPFEAGPREHAGLTRKARLFMTQDYKQVVFKNPKNSESP